MSPGINDLPYNTGALPKSNRRSDRNRQVGNTTNNQDSNWISNDRIRYRTVQPPPQHPNNLSQVEWHPVYQPALFPPPPPASSLRSGKNSNTRFTFPQPPSAPASSAGSYDLRESGHYNGHNRFPNLYSQPENIIPWLKMTSPHQSPPNLVEKPTNTDKMPERHQVEGRLNQIREYIKVTTSMMESLRESTDPRAQAQHEKLSKMVEDLYDSEQKLGKLLEESQKYWGPNENGELFNDEGREQELRKKIDESQRKLAQLQEHQAHLVGMQLRVRERLNEARQAQQALLASEAEEQDEEEEVEPEQRNGIMNGQVNGHVNGQVTPGNVDQLERETEALRGKLQQLENKKRQMDHLVHELQAVELGSCSSEGSRQAPGQQRDRMSELETMKAQLQHLKALMNEATRVQDTDDVQPSDLEPEENGAAAVVVANDEVYPIEENGHEIISEDRSKPTVEQIQAVTRELKEQQQLLLTARAELVRLKQQSSIVNSPSPAVVEKKLSNNDAKFTQNNQRQCEEFSRKESYQGYVANQNGSSDWSNRRDCNSIPHSTTSTANLWNPSSNIMNGPNDNNLDAMSGPETLMEIGSQPPLDSGSNFWSVPPVITNQPPQGATVGSAEYYRQLLLGSQAQQLQMMSTTLQQCCQLLWSQQREMQSMRAAIGQLQAQVRAQSQSRTSNNLEMHEEHHSNLERPATHQHFSSLEAVTLPPSSSLPNLVSLPGASPAPPPAISTMANCQQQQQQLNNQVPPGNRANNYWDNFRRAQSSKKTQQKSIHYSRQNLLSGTPKTVTESPGGHSASSTTVTHPHMNNKRNRQHTLENLPTQPPEVHYCLNLQPQQDRESTASAPRNNFGLTNEQPQLPENVGAEASGPLRPEQRPSDDESYTRIANKISEREDLRLILMHCLKVLESGKQNVSLLPSSNISNSSDSSDDESEAGARGSSTMPIGNINVENQNPTLKCPSTAPQSDMSLNASSGADIQDPFLCENAVSLPSMSSSLHTVDMIDSNQTNPESLNQHVQSNEDHSMSDENYAGCLDVDPNISFDVSPMTMDELLAEDEHERSEFVILDRGSHTAAGGFMDHVNK